MSVSLVTALEVFSNPNDLEISIWKKENGTCETYSTYSFLVSRGPEHNGKLLLAAETLTKSLDEITEVVKKVLEQIHKTAVDAVKKIGAEFDQSKVLTPELIVRICEELRQHKVASTYKMIATAGAQSA